MKLILTSTGFSQSEIPKEVLEQDFDKGLRKDVLVVIITTAAQDKSDDKYAKLAREQFYEIGFENIKFLDLDESDIMDLEDRAVIYVCGGNTYHLYNSMKRRQFKDWMNRNSANLTYIGVSAGSVVVGKTLLPAAESDEFGDMQFDEPALGLLEYDIYVHGDKAVGVFENVLCLDDDEVAVVEL